MGTDLLTLLAEIKMHLRDELTRTGKGKEAVVDRTQRAKHNFDFAASARESSEHTAPAITDTTSRFNTFLQTEHD